MVFLESNPITGKFLISPSVSSHVSSSQKYRSLWSFGRKAMYVANLHRVLLWDAFACSSQLMWFPHRSKRWIGWWLTRVVIQTHPAHCHTVCDLVPAPFLSLLSQQTWWETALQRGSTGVRVYIQGKSQWQTLIPSLINCRLLKISVIQSDCSTKTILMKMQHVMWF